MSGAPAYPSTVGRGLTRSATRQPKHASGRLLKRELRDRLSSAVRQDAVT